MYENESFDPGKATIITDVYNNNDAMLSNSVAAERPKGKSNLKVVIDSANRISVQTDSEREEVLVLNDQYYPGWKHRSMEEKREYCARMVYAGGSW